MRKALKILLVVMVALCYRCYSYAQSDTLWVSDIYTSHVIFDTDLTYVDLSNGMIVAAKIIEQNRNMLAVKGREAFTSLTSLSALESNGRIHTFIVGYDGSPESLIRDMRENASSDGRQVSLNRSSEGWQIFSGCTACISHKCRPSSLGFSCEAVHCPLSGS